MRVGLLLDAACDLPAELLAHPRVRVLPIPIQVGEQTFLDRCNPHESARFYQTLLPQVGPADQSQAWSPEAMQQWFLEQLVCDFDYVICLTVAAERSAVFANATQASFALLQTYREKRAASGHSGPFSLRVIDSRTVFSGIAVLASEVLRLLDAGQAPNCVRERLTELGPLLHNFLLPQDLSHLRRRGFQKGDRTGLKDRLKSAALSVGSLLDVCPIISLTQGEDKPLSLAPSFNKAADKLFAHVRNRVLGDELSVKQICLSYSGDLSAVRDLPGYTALEQSCQDKGVALYLAMLSPTGAINLGAGALSLSLLAPHKEFS